MNIGKRAILLAIALSILTASAVMFAFSQQITGPTSRWGDALSPDKLAARFGNIKTIKRSDILAYLGEPDEGSLVKEYDLWLDKHFVRKMLHVVYHTGVSAPDPNPPVVYIYYDCDVTIFDYKFTLNSTFLNLEKQ